MERSYVICLLADADSLRRTSQTEKSLVNTNILSNILPDADRREIGRELDLNGVVIPAAEETEKEEKKNPSSGVTSSLHKDFIADWSAEHFAVFFDSKGTCRPQKNYTDGLPGMPEAEPAHVVVILSGAAGDEQLAYLHDRKISYAFALEDQVPEEIDPEKALKKLYRLFSVDRLLIVPESRDVAEGGFFRRFINRGLVDEIIVLSADEERPEKDKKEKKNIIDTVSALFTDADGRRPEFQQQEERTFSGGAQWQRFKVKHRENLSRRKMYQTEIGPVCMTEREFEEYMEMRELRELKKGKSPDIIDL